MELYYEGTDITEFVEIKSCVHRDVSGGRCDGLEIELENAARWHSWGPKKDDRIEVMMNGYTTGILFLNTILPEDGRFTIHATSLPSAAYRKAWASFENMTLAAIMRACAAECGMDWRVYGLDENTVFPYLMRKNEGCAAFLHRLMQWEGAVLKCLNGRFTAIGIEYAQAIPATQNVEIAADQSGVRYLRHDGKKLAGVTVKTPYATAEAEDVGADATDRPVYTDLPAMSAMQAGRWARGLLLHNNRMAEELTLPSEFNPGMTAMARIDVDSATGAAGEWLVDEAAHDFVAGKSTAKLLRCIASIR